MRGPKEVVRWVVRGTRVPAYNSKDSKNLKEAHWFLVVAKIGCENVQLKIKTVKSIRNRYLCF